MLCGQRSTAAQHAHNAAVMELVEELEAIRPSARGANIRIYVYELLCFANFWVAPVVFRRLLHIRLLGARLLWL